MGEKGSIPAASTKSSQFWSSRLIEAYQGIKSFGRVSTPLPLA